MSDPLWDLVADQPDLVNLDPGARRLRLRDLAISAGVSDAATSVSQVAEWLDVAGPLSGLLEESEVTDVLVNGTDQVWVERAGELQATELRFDSPESLLEMIERLFGRAGERVDLTHPIADARLQDGSRIHVVLPPIAPRGPAVSIRKHPTESFDLDRLVELGTCTPAQATTLRELVSERASLMISGATGSGKTTLLSSLLGAVPSDQRVITVEETPELRPRHPHVVSLVTRNLNVEGRGEVALPHLVSAALRMRPDRIVIGEVRGAEASAAIQALATGHRGSMLTIHSTDPAAARSRLVALALRDPRSGSQDFIRDSVRAAISAVVQLERKDGLRYISAIDRNR